MTALRLPLKTAVETKRGSTVIFPAGLSLMARAQVQQTPLYNTHTPCLASPVLLAVTYERVRRPEGDLEFLDIFRS